MKFLFLFFFGIFLNLTNLHAQEINQVDANGNRHGLWQKKFKGKDQLRYEGTFEHGKEVGTFKFYCEDCKKVPIAIKEFKANSSISQVKYFTTKGKLASEGKMDGKDRIGEWLFYSKDASKVMTREYYKNGKLDGVKTIYYPNQVKTEEIIYENGVKEGPNNYYSEDGILLKKLNYRNDLLVGPAYYYDSSGNLTIEGNYKEGKKKGLWKYYKNGKVVLEEIYPKPLKKEGN